MVRGLGSVTGQGLWSRSWAGEVLCIHIQVGCGTFSPSPASFQEKAAGERGGGQESAECFQGKTDRSRELPFFVGHAQVMMMMAVMIIIIIAVSIGGHLLWTSPVLST